MQYINNRRDQYDDKKNMQACALSIIALIGSQPFNTAKATKFTYLEEEDYPVKAVKLRIWNQAGNIEVATDAPMESHKPSTPVSLPIKKWYFYDGNDPWRNKEASPLAPTYWWVLELGVEIENGEKVEVLEEGTRLVVKDEETNVTITRTGPKTFKVKREYPQLSEKQKEEYPLLLKYLNAGFHIEEKATLPEQWQLVSSSSNNNTNSGISLEKNNVGIRILGDNYTLYNNLPSLKDFDTVTFLFSVEIRGTRAGTFIQYWDGVKSVDSIAYKGNKKDEWETLSVEFTVNAKAAHFHRLYAAILEPTKGTTRSSMDIRNITLQPKYGFKG